MTTTPLHEQLTAIERELAGLDFDGAHDRVRRAKADLAQLEGRPYDLGSVHLKSPPGNAQSDEQLRARGLVKQAETELGRMDARAAGLRRKAAEIGRLLGASARVDQCKAEAHRAQQTADASAAALAEAEATRARLAEAIEAERREAAAAVDASAALMLKAARDGADAGTVQVRPDKLPALQAALASAETECQRAKAKRAADRSAVDAALRRIRECEADASEVEYRSAEAAFIALATQHAATLTRAGRPAPAFMHLHSQVIAAAQAMEAAP